MSEILEIALGIMTAVGGFVDVSELVFAAQAGSRFLFSLAWAFVLGVVGIAIFGEMSGRVAAVAKEPVFGLIRKKFGPRFGLPVLASATLVNLVTCAAEIGGIALILHLATGWPYRLLAVLATLALVGIVWLLPFKWIERTFGLLGLFMLVFGAATFALHVPFKELAHGLLPQIPAGLSSKGLLSYGYFIVGILSAVLFPYEVYFYSSGAIEDKWGPKDLPVNRITSIVGFGLGSLLAIAILANAAFLFASPGIGPELLGSVALEAAIPFGIKGLYIAIAGMLFAISGAAVETCLAGAYGICQFFGWAWGRYKKPKQTPRFTIAWMALFIVALGIVLTGIDPLQLVEYTIVSSIVLLPFTYLPLLQAAGDRKLMGQHANGRFMKAAGWAFYGLIVVVAVAAIPLFVITAGGKL